MNDKTSVVSVLVHAAIFTVVLCMLWKYYQSEGFQDVAPTNTNVRNANSLDMATATPSTISADPTHQLAPPAPALPMPAPKPVTAPVRATPPPRPATAATAVPATIKEDAKHQIIKAIQGLKL